MGNKILKAVLGVSILVIVAVIIVVVNTIGVIAAVSMAVMLVWGVALGYLAKTLHEGSSKRHYKTSYRYVIPKKRRIYIEEDYT